MVHLIAEGEVTSSRISAEKRVMMSINDDKIGRATVAVAACSELVQMTHRGHEGTG